jgi:uncharacterized membrane protein YeaQ/YmgE (transglycosylase-associated protein family)
MWLKEFAMFLFHWVADHEEQFVFVGIALVSALLSQLFLPGRGFGMLASIVMGFAGCWLGNKFIIEYITFTDIEVLRKIIAGTAGAMLITIPINMVRMGKDKDKSKYRNNP